MSINSTSIQTSKKVIEKNYIFKDTKNLTRLLQISFLILISLHILPITIIAAVSYIWDMSLYTEELQFGFQSIYYVQLFIQLCTFFIFLTWIYRSNVNLRSLNVQGIKFSPGLSVVSYFIPILCIWYPYQALQEIWKASENKSDWIKSKGSLIILCAWILYLSVSILALRLAKSDDPSMQLLLSQDICAVLLYVLTFRIVSQIHAKQSRFFDHVHKSH